MNQTFKFWLFKSQIHLEIVCDMPLTCLVYLILYNMSIWDISYQLVEFPCIEPVLDMVIHVRLLFNCEIIKMYIADKQYGILNDDNLDIKNSYFLISRNLHGSVIKGIGWSDHQSRPSSPPTPHPHFVTLNSCCHLGLSTRERG